MGSGAGIDLGTTYTAAGLVVDGVAEIVTIGHEATVIPSVVARGEDGTLVGASAVRLSRSDPAVAAREFKRRFGDPAPLILGGQAWSAAALMAELARSVMDTINCVHGTTPDAVTLTHPANWHDYKRELLRDVVTQAQLPATTQFLSEPEAAAWFYGAQGRVSPGDVVAVYDLGGGTFDAAVLQAHTAGFSIIGRPIGIERLGGVDFDEALFRYVLAGAGLDLDLDMLDGTDKSVALGLQRLRVDCVEAKEALSDDVFTSVPVALGSVATEIRVTRADFESMIGPSISASVDTLAAAITEAGVRPEELTSVLLVGGSSRIPLVGQLVSGALGRPVAVDAHSKHAIALGAAHHAHASLTTPTPPAAGAPHASEASPTTPTAPASGPERPSNPTERAPRNDRGRPSALLIAGVVGLIAVIGIAVAVLTAGGGDDAATATRSPVPVDSGEPEAEPEAETESQTEPPPELEAEPQPEPEPEAEPQPEPEAAVPVDPGLSSSGVEPVVTTVDLGDRSTLLTSFVDAGRTSASPGPGPVTEPTVLWQVSDPIRSEPVVVGDLIVSGFADRTVRALSIDGGREMWRIEVDHFVNEIFVADDLVIFTQSGDYLVVQLADGAEVGRITRPADLPDNAYTSDPVLVGGTFVGRWQQSDDDDIVLTYVGMDLANQVERWRFSSVRQAYGRPPVEENGRIGLAHGNLLVALDATTGEQLWTRETAGNAPLTLTLAEDTLIIHDSRFRAIDMLTGEDLWSDPDPRGGVHSINNGRVVTMGSNVMAFDLATGSRFWSEPLPDGLSSRGITAQGADTAFVQASDGHVVAYDMADGAALWDVESSASGFAFYTAMTVVGDRLLVVEDDDQMVMLG